MSRKFVLILSIAVGAIGIFASRSFLKSNFPQKDKHTERQTKREREPSLSSRVSPPRPSPFSSQKTTAPIASIPNNIALRQPTSPTSLENMEPWADRPSPHMKTCGEPARARALVKDKSFDLVPNQLGIFQRVYVASQAKIAVEVEYPKASTGEPVIIQVQDGGQLDNGTIAQQEGIKNGKMRFHFRATENPGIHRVSLRKGSDVKTLDFWVGPPLPIRND